MTHHGSITLLIVPALISAILAGGCSSSDPATSQPGPDAGGSPTPAPTTTTSPAQDSGINTAADASPPTSDAQGTATLTIDGTAVPLKAPLLVQEDFAQDCDNFSFSFGTKIDIPVGTAVVWFSFSAKAPGLKPGFASDAIKEPGLDIVYNDPALGHIEMGTNKSYSDRVWTPETSQRIKGTYSYTVTPTINATGAKSDTKRKMVFTYDFAFPPKCAAK